MCTVFVQEKTNTKDHSWLEAVYDLKEYEKKKRKGIVVCVCVYIMAIKDWAGMYKA